MLLCMEKKVNACCQAGPKQNRFHIAAERRQLQYLTLFLLIRFHIVHGLRTRGAEGKKAGMSAACRD
jgi:hypothetical protein